VRRYKPKKDLAVWDIATGKREQTEGARDAWRLCAFMLAEELFPEQFVELRRRVLPIYERHLASLTQPNQEVFIRLSHAHLSCSATVELEERIARWARKLGVICYSDDPDGSPCLPEKDFWLRNLALRRVQSWHAGQTGIPVPTIGGIPRLIIPGLRPGEDRAQFRKRARNATDEYLRKEALPWKASRRWKLHFVWFLRASNRKNHCGEASPGIRS
jgi:hypothetical protein